MLNLHHNQSDSINDNNNNNKLFINNNNNKLFINTNNKNNNKTPYCSPYSNILTLTPGQFSKTSRS